jgi:signal transduction histidine kinase
MTRRSRWADLGLRFKLTLLIEGVVLLVALATGLLVTARVHATLEAELTKRGLAIAADLAMFSVRPLLDRDLATLRRFVNHSMSQDHVRYVAVLDTTGAVVMHSDLGELGKRPGDPLSRLALGSASPGYDTRLVADRAEPLYGIFHPITAGDARLGTVVMGYSRAAAEAEIARSRREIAWIWMVAAAVGGVLAYLLSSYIARPITDIAAAMQRAPDGDLPPVLHVRRGDEVGALASSFNQMAADLSQHRKHLNELVDARTAELRDTNIRLETEIAERRRVEDELRQSREELRRLASHLESVREQERTEIAREIHDELGQALTALKMDVHWVGQRVTDAPPAVSARLTSMSKAVDATVHALRRISSRLRPKLLDDLGLSAAIEWQAREFERHSGIACTIHSEPDDIVVDRPRSTALFRIFQETLTNVARHAGASTVDVVLRDLGSTVQMTVADNGKGIGPAEVNDGRSLGIVGMRERVRSLGGSIEVLGRPGQGTTVRVSIPSGREDG